MFEFFIFWAFRMKWPVALHSINLFCHLINPCRLFCEKRFAETFEYYLYGQWRGVYHVFGIVTVVAQFVRHYLVGGEVCTVAALVRLCQMFHGEVERGF